MQSQSNENNNALISFNTPTHFNASEEAKQIAQLVVDNDFSSFEQHYIKKGNQFTHKEWSDILCQLTKWRSKNSLTVFHIAAGNNGIAFLSWFNEKGLDSTNIKADITLVVFDEIHNYQLNSDNFANYLENITAVCILNSENKTYTSAVKEVGTYGINLESNSFPKISINYRFDTARTKIIEKLFYNLHNLITKNLSDISPNLKMVIDLLNLAEKHGVKFDILAALNNINYESNNKILPILLKNGFLLHAETLISYGVQLTSFFEEGEKKQSCFSLAVSKQSRTTIFQIIENIKPSNIINQYVFRPSNKQLNNNSNRPEFNHDDLYKIHTLFKPEQIYAYWVGFYFFSIADKQIPLEEQQTKRLKSLFYLLLADPMEKQSACTTMIACLISLRFRCTTTSEYMPSLNYNKQTLLEEFGLFVKSDLFNEFQKIVEAELKAHFVSPSLLGKAFFNLQQNDLAKTFLSSPLVEPAFFPYVDAEACHATGMIYLQDLTLDTHIYLAGQHLYQAAACHHLPSMPALTRMLESTDTRIQQAAQTALAKTILVFASHADSLNECTTHVTDSIFFISNNAILKECVNLIENLKDHQATISFHLYNYVLFAHQNNASISKKDIALTLPLLPILLRDKKLKNSIIKDIEGFYLTNPLVRLEALKILLLYYITNKPEEYKIVRLFCELLREFRSEAKKDPSSNPIVADIIKFFTSLQSEHSELNELIQTFCAILSIYLPEQIKPDEKHAFQFNPLVNNLEEKEIQDAIVYLIDNLGTKEGQPIYAQATITSILYHIKKMMDNPELTEKQALAIFTIFIKSKKALDTNLLEKLATHDKFKHHITEYFVLKHLPSRPSVYFNIPFAKQKKLKTFETATKLLFELYEGKTFLVENPAHVLKEIANSTADGLANFLYSLSLLQQGMAPIPADLEASKSSGFPLASAMLSLCTLNSSNKFANYEKIWAKKSSQSAWQSIQAVLDEGIFDVIQVKELRDHLADSHTNSFSSAATLLAACLRFAVKYDIKEKSDFANKVAFIIHKLIHYSQPTLQQAPKPLENSFASNLILEEQAKNIPESQTTSLLSTDNSNNNNTEDKENASLEDLEKRLSFYFSKTNLGTAERDELIKPFCSFIEIFRLAISSEDIPTIDRMIHFIANIKTTSLPYTLSNLRAIFFSQLPFDQYNQLTSLYNSAIDNSFLLSYITENVIQDFVIFLINSQQSQSSNINYFDQSTIKKLLTPAISQEIKKLQADQNLPKAKVMALMRFFLEIKNKNSFTWDDFITFVNNPSVIPYLTHEFILQFLFSRPESYLDKTYPEQKSIKIFKLATDAILSLYEKEASIAKEKTTSLSDTTSDALTHFLRACYLIQTDHVLGYVNYGAIFHHLIKAENQKFPLASPLKSLVTTRVTLKEFAKYEMTWKEQSNQLLLQQLNAVLESGPLGSFQTAKLRQKLAKVDTSNLNALVTECIRFVVDSDLKENDTTTIKIAFIIHKLMLSIQAQLQLAKNAARLEQTSAQSSDESEEKSDTPINSSNHSINEDSGESIEFDNQSSTSAPTSHIATQNFLTQETTEPSEQAFTQVDNTTHQKTTDEDEKINGTASVDTTATSPTNTVVVPLAIPASTTSELEQLQGASPVTKDKPEHIPQTSKGKNNFWNFFDNSNEEKCMFGHKNCKDALPDDTNRKIDPVTYKEIERPTTYSGQYWINELKKVSEATFDECEIKLYGSDIGNVHTIQAYKVHRIEGTEEIEIQKKDDPEVESAINLHNCL